MGDQSNSIDSLIGEQRFGIFAASSCAENNASILTITENKKAGEKLFIDFQLNYSFSLHLSSYLLLPLSPPRRRLKKPWAHPLFSCQEKTGISNNFKSCRYKDVTPSSNLEEEEDPASILTFILRRGGSARGSSEKKGSKVPIKCRFFLSLLSSLDRTSLSDDTRSIHMYIYE